MRWHWYFTIKQLFGKTKKIVVEMFIISLLSTNSISVHIRRGDYIKERRRADYEVCTATYYRRAIEYIQAHVESPIFYVFSDDPTWGKEQNIFPTDTIFVSGHQGEDAYIDMQLMSLCRHHVIANSSFSWWE